MPDIQDAKPLQINCPFIEQNCPFIEQHVDIASSKAGP
jgi:hypothetical protein